MFSVCLILSCSYNLHLPGSELDGEDNALKQALLSLRAHITVVALRADMSAWNAVKLTAVSRPERPTFGSSQAFHIKRSGTSD